MNIEVCDFRKVDLLNYKYKFDKNICTELLKTTVFEIVVKVDRQNPLDRWFPIEDPRKSGKSCVEGQWGSPY